MKLRLSCPGRTTDYIDLQPATWVPIHGTATLRGHAVVGRSGTSDTKDAQAAYQRASVARRKARGDA